MKKLDNYPAGTDFSCSKCIQTLHVHLPVAVAVHKCQGKPGQRFDLYKLPNDGKRGAPQEGKR